MTPFRYWKETSRRATPTPRSGIVKRFASSEEIEKREPTAWKSASTEAIRSPGRKRMINVRVGQLILDIMGKIESDFRSPFKLDMR